MQTNHTNNKNTLTIILAIAAVVGIVGLAAIYGGGNTASRQQASTGGGSMDHMGEGSAAVDGNAARALIGKPVPAFSLADMNGTVYTPASLKGKNVVLFFNEGLMCYPACWNQIAKFGSDARFKSADTVALSIVADPKDQWKQAVDKMPELAAATVLFDEGANVSRSFSVLSMPSSMHTGSLPGHTYVLIDKNGIVRDVVDDPRMAINNDRIAEAIGRFGK